MEHSRNRIPLNLFSGLLLAFLSGLSLSSPHRRFSSDPLQTQCSQDLQAMRGMEGPQGRPRRLHWVWGSGKAWGRRQGREDSPGLAGQGRGWGQSHR